MKGASLYACRLMTCDGTGSMLHVLPGDPRNSFSTSSLVTDAKRSRVTEERWWMSGHVTLDVSSWMFWTIFKKNLAKSSAVWSVETFLLKLALVSPERFRHSFLEYPRPSTILPRQYSPSFPLNSLCMARWAPIQISLSLSFFDFSYLFWSILTRRRSAWLSLSNHGDVWLFRTFIILDNVCREVWKMWYRTCPRVRLTPFYRASPMSLRRW